MTIFENYRAQYRHAILASHSKKDLEASLVLAESNVDRILSLTVRTRPTNLRLNLFNEYKRIFSTATRRFYEILEIQRAGLLYSLNDELRSLFELMLQAFYLVRSEDPEQAALDAFNLSAISWAAKRDELVGLGFVGDGGNAKSKESEKQAREKIFPQYAKRKPAFYADHTQKKLAKLAGLGTLHTWIYSLFSSISHNEPFIDDKTEQKNGNEIVLPLIPMENEITGFVDFFHLAHKIYLLTAMCTVSQFLKVNKETFVKTLSDFRTLAPEETWRKEFDTIEANIAKSS